METSEAMTTNQQMFAVTEMIAQLALLGLPVDVDPDVADHMGAFEEGALDVDEAEESRFDVDPETGIVVDDSMEGGA